MGTDDCCRRQYSGMSGTKLQLQKLQSSPLYMVNSKRNVEYNVFYLLVNAVESQFIWAKGAFGMEWWATIILCTMPYRVALAYLLKKKGLEEKYKAQDIFENQLAKLEKEEKRKLTLRPTKDLSEKEKRRMFKHAMKVHQKRIYKEEKYSPWTVLILNFSPLPFWVANSWALRNISGAKIPFMENVATKCLDMQTGGILWFPNLCVPDPYHILPILTSLSFLMAIEMNTLTNRNYGSGTVTPHKISKYIEHALRGWCIFTILLFWNCPASMTWYWFISGFLSLITRLCLMHPSIEKRLVPPNKHHNIDEHPYRTILTNMNKRYNPKNWFLS